MAESTRNAVSFRDGQVLRRTMNRYIPYHQVSSRMTLWLGDPRSDIVGVVLSVVDLSGLCHCGIAPTGEADDRSVGCWR
jgi:hypothetical protein